MKKGKQKYYPSWICHECAMANGGVVGKNQVSTIHEDTCGWCNQTKMVTEPRDYRFPTFTEKEKK
jgi:hypothetical protein